MSIWRDDMTREQRFDSLWMPVPWSGCWLWLGYGTKEGYGRIEFAGRKYLAHRVSYERFVGPVADGMLVLHRCDIPSCVNPAHLFLGTDLINTLDKLAKGRHAHGPEHSAWVRGEKQHMAKLTDEIVRRIRDDRRAQSAIAAEYGIAQSHVSQIKRRVIWKHVG